MESTPQTPAEKPQVDAKVESKANGKAGAREAVALTDGLGGILGVKAGMTQVFTENGNALAVTVIDLKPNVITQIKTAEKNGYKGIQVGFLEKRKSRTTKSEVGHLKAANAQGFHHYQEFRLPDDAKMEGLTVGKILSPEFVKEGDSVDLTAMSKGKGFQGGMKRYHMGGGPKTHGASLFHRHLGSIGNRADPSKVFKNKKMAGHMGHEKVTVQNVQVVGIDLENQVMLVHGSVPGPKSGIVTVRRTVKNAG